MLPRERLKQRIIKELGYTISDGSQIESIYYSPRRADEFVSRWVLYDPVSHKRFWSVFTIPELLRAPQLKVRLDDGIEVVPLTP